MVISRTRAPEQQSDYPLAMPVTDLRALPRSPAQGVGWRTRYYSRVVLDTLPHWRRYAALHPAFTQAFQFLDGPALTRLTSAYAGIAEHSVRHAIDAERLYVSIDRVQGRGRERSRLEAHRRYIDIQLTIEGHEEIGWKPLGDCTRPDGPLDEARDVGFFSDRPESWLSLPAGHFAIFFPDDAHAPLAGGGTLVKAIVKIAVE